MTVNERDSGVKVVHGCFPEDEDPVPYIAYYTYTRIIHAIADHIPIAVSTLFS